jgi:hypothetical protein
MVKRIVGFTMQSNVEIVMQFLLGTGSDWSTQARHRNQLDSVDRFGGLTLF